MAGKGKQACKSKPKRGGGCIRYRGKDADGVDIWELRLGMGTVIETLPDGTKKKVKKVYSEMFHGSDALARARLADIVSEKNKGKLPMPDKITVAEWLEYWFQSGCKAGWRVSTQRANRRNIRLITEVIGDCRLQKLTFSDIENTLDSVKAAINARGRDGSGTISMLFVALNSALELAVTKQVIAANPARLVNRPRYRADKRVAWTPEEQRRFLAVAQRYRHYPIWLIMLRTGLRIGEVCGLKWSDIDLDGLWLTVRRTRRRHGTRIDDGPPKSVKSERSMAITPEIAQALRRWRVIQNEDRLRLGAEWPDKENMVFTNRHGRINDYSSVRISLMRVCKKAGVRYDGQHLCRHCFGTNSVRAGVDPQQAAEDMGHASVGFFLDTYVSEPTPDEKRQAMERRQRYLEQA